MSSSRLFSQPQNEKPAGISSARKIFMDGLAVKINNHIMGTHILAKVDVGTARACINDLNHLEREYIRNRLSPCLPNWKVDSPLNFVDENAHLFTADFYFGFMRVMGGVVISVAEAMLLLYCTDSFVASSVGATVTSLGFIAMESCREVEHGARNDRMHDFISPLESCGLKLPVEKDVREARRQMNMNAAEETSLRQETQNQMRSR